MIKPQYNTPAIFYSATFYLYICTYSACNLGAVYNVKVLSRRRFELMFSWSGGKRSNQRAS